MVCQRLRRKVLEQVVCAAVLANPRGCEAETVAFLRLISIDGDGGIGGERFVRKLRPALSGTGVQRPGVVQHNRRGLRLRPGILFRPGSAAQVELLYLMRTVERQRVPVLAGVRRPRHGLPHQLRRVAAHHIPVLARLAVRHDHRGPVLPDGGDQRLHALLFRPDLPRLVRIVLVQVQIPLPKKDRADGLGKAERRLHCLLLGHAVSV